jgi:hypothetical protein
MEQVGPVSWCPEFQPAGRMAGPKLAPACNRVCGHRPLLREFLCRTTVVDANTGILRTGRKNVGS